MSGTSPEGARLAAELRALREKSGLSLVALADASGYSKSSWQRYLSGKALPPWLAVRALCVLAAAPEPRLRAVWDLAEAAWSGRDVVEPGAVALAEPVAVSAPVPAASARPDETAPVFVSATPGGAAFSGAEVVADTPRRSRRQRFGWALGLAVLCGAVTAAGLTMAADHSTASGSDFHVGCTGTACSGQDPQVTLCGVEPQTLLDLQTPQGAGVEIRYNPLCRAVWARAWNTKLGETLVLNDAGGAAESVVISRAGDQDQFVFTPLLGLATGKAEALRVCLNDRAGDITDCYGAKTP